jgi:hypothetical protein
MNRYDHIEIQLNNSLILEKSGEICENPQPILKGPLAKHLKDKPPEKVSITKFKLTSGGLVELYSFLSKEPIF